MPGPLTSKKTMGHDGNHNKRQAARDDASEPRAVPRRPAAAVSSLAVEKVKGRLKVCGFRVRGLVVWRSVYLAKPPGVRQEVRVAIRWTLDLLFSRRIEQFVTL